jgi:ABC-type Fe3+/spermidine/putrescine transport system ATPase subunit
VTEAIIRLERIEKNYGETDVVQDLNLEVQKGEFFSLLGPSGCGKTTTLRMIAGLSAPSGGEVFLAGRRATDTPPHQRNLGMVFQNYALFPHMTVEGNVAYGLRCQGVDPREIKERTAHYLDLVGLAHLAKRKPRELSGGQQQRVALARALAIEPVVLLLDEPLSNLDAKMREEMQLELKSLHAKLGFTAFYVTHDQDEALAMSDRLGIMREGRLEQVGTPEEIYNRPANAFVADFIGGTNLIPGQLTGETFQSRYGDHWPYDRIVGRGEGEATLAIRPTMLEFCSPGEGYFTARIDQSRYMGDRSVYRVALASGQILEVCSNNGRAYKKGDEIGLKIKPGATSVFCGREN